MKLNEVIEDGKHISIHLDDVSSLDCAAAHEFQIQGGEGCALLITPKGIMCVPYED